MAAIGAKQEAAFGELSGHPFHMFRVHGIVRAADGERGYFNLRQIGFSIPFFQFP